MSMIKNISKHQFKKNKHLSEQKYIFYQTKICDQSGTDYRLVFFNL